MRRISKSIIIAIVIMLIFLFFYSNLRGDSKDEATLRSRYYELVGLLNEKKYGEAYDQFVADTNKVNTTRQKYIDDAVESDNKIVNYGVIETEHLVNEIKIKDNIGFIDRTVAYCLNQDCSDKEARRGYKKMDIHW